MRHDGTLNKALQALQLTCAASGALQDRAQLKIATNYEYPSQCGHLNTNPFDVERE